MSPRKGRRILAAGMVVFIGLWYLVVIGLPVNIALQACPKCEILTACHISQENQSMHKLDQYTYPFDGLGHVSVPTKMEYIQIKTVNPFQIASLDHGDLITKTLKGKGMWDTEKVNFIRAVIEKAGVAGRRPSQMTFVDVGANIGAIGFVAHAMGVTTYFVEPVDMHVAMIRATALRNSFIQPGKIYILPFAFGDYTGKSVIQVLHTNHGGSTLVPEKVEIENGNVESSQTVRVERFDDWITASIDILKVDVEGFEKCVVKGALNMFYYRRVKFIMMEVWSSITICENSGGLFEWIERQGYNVYPESDWQRAISGDPPQVHWRQLRGTPTYADYIMKEEMAGLNKKYTREEIEQFKRLDESLPSKCHKSLMNVFKTGLPRPNVHLVDVVGSDRFPLKFSRMAAIFEISVKNKKFMKEVDRKLKRWYLAKFVKDNPHCRFFVRSDFSMKFHYMREISVVMIIININYVTIDLDKSPKVYEIIMADQKKRSFQENKRKN